MACAASAGARGSGGCADIGPRVCGSSVHLHIILEIHEDTWNFCVLSRFGRLPCY